MATKKIGDTPTKTTTSSNSYADLKKQAKEEKYGGSSTTSSGGTHKNVSSYADLKKQARQEKFDEDVNKVDSNYINIFINGVNSYYSSVDKEYGSITWGNASNVYQSKLKSTSDLDYRRDVIRKWLEKNKSRLNDEDYFNITSTLNSYDTNVTSILDAFKKRGDDLHSTYKTQEEYDTAVRQSGYWQEAQGKDYIAIREELLNLDPNSEEYKWLKSYAPTILTEDNIDEAITRVDGEVNTLTNVLDSWDYWSDIIDRYNKYGYRDSAFPVPEETILGQIKTQKIFLDRYGSVDGMRSALASSRQELWDLENQKKYGYLNENDDFRAVSSNVATDLPTGLGMFTADSTYYYINDVDGYRMQVAGQTAMGGRGNPDEKYNYMKQDEIDTYNYLYNKEGKAVAEDYLYSIENMLASRQYENVYKDNTALELLFGIEAGLDQFGSGIKNLLNTTDAYIPPSSTQVISGLIREDLADDSIPLWYNFKTGEWEDKVFGNSLGQMGYDTITTTTNMAPSILASTAIGLINPTAGAITGNALLGASAAGNAYQQKLNLGYTKEEAKTYGVLVGASEALLQYALGGIGALSKNGLTHTILKNLDAVDNVFARFAKTAGGKFLLSASSEALEEGLQAVIEPYLWQAVSGETATVDMQESLYNALLGFVSGGLFEGPGIVVESAVNRANTSKENTSTGRAIMGMEGGAKSLMSLYQKVAGVSTGKSQRNILKQIENVSSKVDKGSTSDRTARKVAGLYNSVKSAIGTQNHADIVKSLTRGENGFSAKEANRIAGALIAFSNGLELTAAQTNLLDSVADNPKVQQALDGVILNDKSTMAQRNQTMKDFNADINIGVLANAIGKTKEELKEALEPATYKSLTERAGTEGRFGVSESGKAVIRSTNEEIDINSLDVATVGDGELTFKVGDREVSAGDIDFVDDNQSFLVSAVANIENITAKDATVIIHDVVDMDKPLGPQLNGIDEAFTYGFYGYSVEDLKAGEFGKNLTDKQLMSAYELGKAARKDIRDRKVETFKMMRTAADAIAEKNAAEGKSTPGAKNLSITFDKGNGEVVAFDEVFKPGQLDEKRSGAVGVAEILHKMGLGTRVEFFESFISDTLTVKDRKTGEVKKARVFIDENGNEKIAYSGVYRKSDGTIRVDLNAYNGRGLTLNALAHELTHFIQQWSETKYKVLVDFLMETYEKTDMTMHKRVLREQKRLEDIRGEEVSYNEAYDEVVANAMMKMFDDGKLVERLTELKAKDKNLAQKLWEGFKKILAKFLGIYEKEGALFKDTADLMEMKETFEQLQNMFAEALVEASENYQASLTPGVEGTTFNAKGEAVAHSTKDGTIQLSMHTYETEGKKALHDYLKKCVSSNKLTQAEMNEMINGIEDIYQTCKEFKDKYAPFSTWSDAAVVRDTHGRPVFSVVTPNGDYKMNLDFSLVCKKRRTLDAVFNEMSKRGIIDDFELGQKSVVKINEIIRRYGFETACALCFVDAKRFRQASMADSFTRLYNELVESLVPEDKKSSISYFNFSGYETIKDVENGIDTWDNSKLDFSHINHVLKTYESGTVEYKTAKYIKSHAEGRKLLLRGDFMSSSGFDAVKTRNPDVLKLYNSKKGTGGPKAAFGDVQYMNEIIKKARWWTPAKAYSVGGVRVQSFSDYVPRMVFDYVQMVYDLAATKLPAHAYTKEALFVKQFGLTGIKINMSLIPAIAKNGIAPGLDANGNYVWAGESFDYETAKDIQNADGYTENCGTICVGVSYDHIVKLLNDPNIRMVIPYHKSGLNPIVAHMNQIAEFHDYTNDQRTKGKDGKAVETDFDFSKALHDMGENANPKAVADQYLKWCATKGYTPRFAEFAMEDNYYKLLEDFTLYDKEGNYVPQREVRAVFPTDDSAFGSMKSLIKEGLQEDAVIEGKRDKMVPEIVDEIQKSLPKTEDEIDETQQVEQADHDLEAVEMQSSQNTELDTKTDSVYDGGKKGEKQEVNLYGQDGKAEDHASFIRRMHEGLRRVKKIGETTFGYEPARAIDTSGSVSDAAREFRRLGIKYFYHNGLEYNHNGITYVDNGDLCTIEQQVVGIYAKAFGDGVEFAGHEAFHFWKNSTGWNAYVETLRRNISDTPSVYGIELANTVLREYFGGDVEALSSEESKAQFQEELYALVSGKIHSGANEAGLKTMFKDYTAVKAAWDDLVKKQTTQKGKQYSSQETDRDRAERAWEYFGETDNPYHAGYMLADGTMLNFRNENNRMGWDLSWVDDDALAEGVDPYHIDHHAIYEMYDGKYDDDPLEAIDQFVDEGNVRMVFGLSDTENAIQLSPTTKPTAKQYDMIRQLADQTFSEGKVFGVGLSGFKTYDKYSNGSAVVNDIKYYYANGKHRSSINDFRYSSQETDADNAPTFYSQMAKVVDGMKQEKFGASSVISMLRGRGVKAEEIKWSGIEAFLDGKKSVTKAELQEFIAGSMLQVNEVVLDGSTASNVEIKETGFLKNKVEVYVNGKLEDTFTKNRDGMYVSKNNPSKMYGDKDNILRNAKIRAKNDFRSGNNSRWSKYKLDGGENYREIVFTLPGSSFANAAMNVHWGPNAKGVLAHARVQDFNVDGNKMLFIEEIQSDWHNQGHKQGYAPKGEMPVVDPYAETEGVAADAPFRENYHEFVLKSILRQAAENDYDSIGWTTADIQSERWSDEFAEGYRIEYDQDIPKFLKKYGKQWGATVGKTTLPRKTIDLDAELGDEWLLDDAELPDGLENIRETQWVDDYENGNEVWTMDITPAMKESVLKEGQALYSSQETDEDYIKYDRTALLKESKVDEYLNDYAAWGSPKYTQAYITYIRPRDFLKLTTTGIVERYYIDEQAGKLDAEKLSNSRPGIYLRIDHETGKVIGHEGRHRMSAMGNAGIDRVPVLLVDESNNRTKTNIDQMYLHGQYDETAMSLVKDVIPLSVENRGRIIEKFATQSSNQRIGEQIGYNKTLRFSEHDTDYSNRDLLANAFEGLSQNSEEYKMIQEYKGRIKLLNEQESKLAKLNAEILDIRFTKGKYNAKKLKELEAKAKNIANDINRQDRKLLDMEASEPLRKVIEQERKKEAEKTKAHVKEIQQNKKLRAEQTELRHKIRKAVRDLDKLLNRGNKKTNVKEDMKDFVSKALEIADYLFTDHISNDELIRRGITVPMRGNEAKLVKETEDIIAKLDAATDINNPGSKMTDEEFTRLDEKRKRNLEKLKDLLTEQRNERLSTPVAKLFDDLVKAYASLKHSSQDAVKAAYNEELEKSLRAFMSDDKVKILENMRVADMTAEELNWLYRAYTMVLTNVRNANKFHVKGMNETIDQKVNRIVSDFSSRKTPDKKVAIIARNLANKIGWDYEKLHYALDRIGSEAFTELIMNLANSENIVMADVIEAALFRDKIVERYGFNNWHVNKQIDREFLDNTGKKFKLTLGELMSLYAYSRREGAWDHIEYGGFVFGKNDITNPKPADTYKLSKKQCEAITNTLTSKQKGYVEEMQKFLSETMGAKGNEVSMQLYGIKMFGEKNYFPIHIAGQFKAQAQESQAKTAAGFGTMSNAGFTHSQNPNAKAPFVLESFNEVWADHVNEMSRYHGAVPALEDIRRVMNRSSYSDANNSSESVTAAMENAFGKAAVDYFDNLYREANSGAITDKLQRIPKKLLSLFRKNSVAYSLSVLIQQPTSIIRAYAMIPKKYFGFKGFGTITSGVVKAVTSKWNSAYSDAYNEMLKYAPGVTLAKEIGGFDTHTGGSIRSYLLDTNKSIKQKWNTGTALEKGKAALDLVDNNAIANLPNVADKIAWIEIWNAVKRETVATHKDLVPNSEEFMQAVGERFTEVIRATQVYDSIFAKSPMMKSKNLAVQYLTSFMNEPNTVANMAESAVRDAVRGDWKSGVKKAAVLVYGTIAVGAMKSLIYALRDDDDDETYIEKYIESLTESLVSDFNPLSYIPVVRDISSALQGYDVERPDMSIIVDVIEAVQASNNLANKDTEDMTEEQLAELEKKIDEATWDVVESVASVFGIPVKNIRRDVKAIFVNKSANVGLSTKLSLTHKLEEAFNNSQYFFLRDESKSKQDKLYEAIVAGDTTYVNRLKAGYKDDDAYNSAIRKLLREKDSRIHEAALAYYNGNLDEYKRIFKEIRNDDKHNLVGYDNTREAILSEVSSIKSKLEGKTESSDYSSTDYVNSILLGYTDQAAAIRENIINYKVAHGSTRIEADVAFNSSVSTSTRNVFDSGLLDEAGAEKMLQEYAGMDEEEAVSKVNYWSFIKSHPQYRGELSQANVEDYIDFAEPAEIPLDVFVQYLENTKGLKDIEDEWGVLKSKREQVLEAIDALPLDWKQKNALYLAYGYKESTMWNVPW